MTLWAAAHQASLSVTNSWSLLKLGSIESVMPSNHLILCRPLFLLPSIFPSIRVFSNESVLCIMWPKYWGFSISPSNEYSGLTSFRMDWLDLFAVQGTLKSLFQHRSSEASVLWGSAVWATPLSLWGIRRSMCLSSSLRETFSLKGDLAHGPATTAHRAYVFLLEMKSHSTRQLVPASCGCRLWVTGLANLHLSVGLSRSIALWHISCVPQTSFLGWAPPPSCLSLYPSSLSPGFFPFPCPYSELQGGSSA